MRKSFWPSTLLSFNFWKSIAMSLRANHLNTSSLSQSLTCLGICFESYYKETSCICSAGRRGSEIDVNVYNPYTSIFKSVYLILSKYDLYNGCHILNNINKSKCEQIGEEHLCKDKSNHKIMSIIRFINKMNR